MRGLMTKDFRLLFRRKQNILILLVLAIWMALSMDDSAKGGFLIGYITFFSVIFSTSTVSMDENDNGYLFLMSLPINARTYVLEKYIFSSLCGVIAWAAGVLLTCSVLLFRRMPFDAAAVLQEAVFVLPAALLMLSCILFFFIKFGTARAGIVLVAFAGAFSALIVFVGKLELPIWAFAEKIGQQPMGVLVAAAFAVGMTLMLLFAAASIRAMEKKEF